MRRGPERGAVIRGTTLGGLAAGRRLASRGVPAVVVGPADFQGVLHTSVVDGFVLDAALAPVSATALCEVLDPRPLVPLLRPLAAGLVGPDGQVHDLADALPSDLSPDAPWAALAERTSVRGRLLASVSHDSTGSASLRAACLAVEEWTLDPDLVAGGLARLGDALASGLLIVPADHPAARGGDGWLTLDADGAPDLRALDAADHWCATASATWWFAAPEPPTASRRLHLGDGLVVNACVVSNTDPGRAPTGALIGVTTHAAAAEEVAVRREAGRLLGDTDPRWTLLRRIPGPGWTPLPDAPEGPAPTPDGCRLVPVVGVAQQIAQGQRAADHLADRLGKLPWRRLWTLERDRQRWSDAWGAGYEARRRTRGDA